MPARQLQLKDRKLCGLFFAVSNIDNNFHTRDRRLDLLFSCVIKYKFPSRIKDLSPIVVDVVLLRRDLWSGEATQQLKSIAALPVSRLVFRF